MKKLTVLSLIIALAAAAGAAHAGGDVAAGEAKAANCAGCHGLDGKGNPENPPIAGLDEEEFFALLDQFQTGERENAMMQMFADELTEQDKADLAAYYATLPAE